VKFCSSCGEPKSESEFWKNSKARDGLNCACKKCLSAKHFIYYKANQTKITARQAKWSRQNRDRRNLAQWKWKYGFSRREHEALKSFQENRCAICSAPKRLYVDHNHATDRVRGLLCGACNSALGLFKDSVPSLEKAVAYLQNPPINSIPKER